MALNIYQKLIAARKDFRGMSVKKSGINRHLSFTYFRLDDIVSAGEKALEDNGLGVFMGVEEGDMVARVFDLTDTKEFMNFAIPFLVDQPLINQKGNYNSKYPQEAGAAITYYRRYLWQLVLDIIEEDVLEESVGRPETTIKTKAAPPPTKVEKDNAQEQIMDADGAAPKTLVTSLKKKLKDLLTADPTQASWVQSVVDSMDKLSKADVESLIIAVNKNLKEG